MFKMLIICNDCINFITVMDNNDPQTHDNVISFQEANRHALNVRLEEMETRVAELESSIIEHASNLQCLFIETLDQVAWCEIEAGLAEFSEFPQGQGNLTSAKIQPGEVWMVGGDTNDRFASMLADTDEQLQLLNDSIEQLQLSR